MGLCLYLVLSLSYLYLYLHRYLLSLSFIVIFIFILSYLVSSCLYLVLSLSCLDFVFILSCISSVTPTHPPRCTRLLGPTVFTITDGAIRLIVLLHAKTLGFTPIQIALMFVLYELAGVFTNLFGGIAAGP
jgi:hypothetical protein